MVRVRKLDRAALKRFWWVCSLLAAIAGLLALATLGAGNVSAHEDAEEHGGIWITPVVAGWSDDGSWLEVDLEIIDDHPASISRPNNEIAWHYRWFSYEYIPGSEFDCRSEHFGLTLLNLEDWLADNGYDNSVYETQKDVFRRGANLFGVFLETDGGYSDTVLLREKSDITKYINGDGNLAVCLEIRYDDGSHVALNSMVFDFDDLTNSQTGVGLAADGQNGGAGNSSDSAPLNQGIGGTGGGPGQEDLPETGLIEGLDDSLILTISLSSLAIITLALLKIIYSAKRHRQQK